jgi:acetylornithine deacetylase
MGEIKAVASGQLEFSITVKGSAPDTTEPGHTAFSHLGVNPIEKAIKIIDGLSTLNEARNSRILHKRIHSAVGRSTNLHISRITANSEEKLSRLNETCTLGGAISFPPGEGLSEVKAEVENTIKKVAQNDAWLKLHYPKITWISGVTGGEVEENSLFYQVASSAIKKITGDLPDVNPMHTSSDIRNPIVEADIPCVGLGCLGGNLSQNNKVDEWIDINDFNRMVEVTSEIIERWCSGEQKKEGQTVREND